MKDFFKILKSLRVNASSVNKTLDVLHSSQIDFHLLPL